MALQKETSQKLGKKEAEIFEVQILLLHDATLRNEITIRCLRERINVEAALAGALEKLTSLFARWKTPISESGRATCGTWGSVSWTSC